MTLGSSADPSKAEVIELEINLDKLPALPELPEALQEVPFIHKSYLLAQQGPRPNGLECEIKSNKRMEIIGDAVLSLAVTSLLHARKSLTSNALFSRLALAYGLDKRLRVQFQLERDERHKIYADTFEAYVGTLYEAIDSHNVPKSSLDTYFAELYSTNVFPNLDDAVNAWQDHRLAVKKGHSARSSASKKKNKRLRKEKADQETMRDTN